MNTKRLMNVILLVSIIAVAAFIAATLLSEKAAGDAYKVDLRVKDGYTNDNSGLPGDKVKFYLEVENKGTEDDSYTITNDSLPAGWKIIISPTSTSELSFGDTANVIISVTIPEWANATDSVDFTITATSQNDPSSPPTKDSELLTCEVDQKYDIDLSPIAGEPTTKDVDPGKDTYFLLKITNNGNGEDTIDFSYSLPSGHDDWVVIFSSNSVTLDKNGDNTSINISVTVPNGEDAGNIPLQITATSEDGTTTDSQTLVPHVNFVADFIVTPYGSNQKKVEPKESVTYGISIENKGNDEDTFHFTIVSGSWSANGWSASLDYNSITVDKNEKVNLSSFLTVNAPDGLADDEANVIVNVTSDDGTTVKTLNTRTKISQKYDPGINIVGGTTKDVDPGQSVDFTVTVINSGNGEDEITLHVKNADQMPGSWASWSDSSVTLQHNSNTTVTLTVTPPSDAAYRDEGYTIEIYGVSEDGVNESTHKTLRVNVNKKFDLSVTISGASTKKVNPDDTVEYTVTVKNKGNADDTILLSLFGLDSTYKPEWGSIVSSVDLTRGQTTNVTLSVTVPDDAPKADYKIGIKGTSDEDPSPNPVNKTTEVIVSVNQTYGIIITIPASQKTVDVDSTVDYQVTIKNDGTGNDTITLEVTDYPEGWQINFNESTLELDAKESANVLMTVKTPKNEEHKAFYVNFTATSQGDKSVVETGTTITTVNQTYEFNIVPSPDYKSVLPGETIVFNISFENTGTGNDHIDITKSGDYLSTWTASIASQLAINMGETVYKTLTVSVDDETPKGEYHINITGTSSDDPHTPAFSRTVTITIDVQQLYNLTTSIGTDTMSVDPFPPNTAHEVTFTFKVNNTGTGQDTFDFSSSFDPTPTRKSGWSTSFNPSSVTLGIKEERDIKMTVSVPDKENTDTYGITITVTSQGDSSVSRTLKVYVDVNQTYSVDLTSDLNTQQVTPSEVQGDLTEINFTITVTNTGTGQDKFYLSLTGLPDGWYKNLPGNTGIISKDASKDVVLNVKVPGREKPGTYNLTVTATSDGKSSITQDITLQVVVNELHALDLSTNEPIKKGDVNAYTYFDVVVTNKGTGEDTFTFDFKDVPNPLTVSFPDGTGTDEIGPNNQTTKRVRVFVEDKTPKAKFSFNISVTSDENNNVVKEIMLTVDVNQSYEVKASEIQSPPGNKVDPGDTAVYLYEITNSGTGTDSVTVEVPTSLGNKTNVPAGWKVTPAPYTFDLDSNQLRNVTFEVEVDKDAEPALVLIQVWFWYHDETEKVIRNLTVNVNQTYDVSVNMQPDYRKIYPGYNDTAELIIKNTGTGVDYYKVEITTANGIDTELNTTLTDNINPGEQVKVKILFEVNGGEAPRTETFTLTVTSQKAEEDNIELSKNATIDIEIGETYGVSFNKLEETKTAYPTHDSPGTVIFTLSVKNDGTNVDTMNLELVDDQPNSTIGKYNKWATLSTTSLTLNAGQAQSVTLTVEVPTYETDHDAIADDILKNIRVLVYSKKARDNLVEEEGTTTDTFTAHVRIQEYQYALITSVVPSSQSIDIGETKTVNFTIKNEGNGIERYSFVKDGEDDGGQNADWYDFNVSSVLIEPFETTQVSILVTPATDAPVGLHNLYFHAESESTYETAHSQFTIDIQEKFGAIFTKGDTKSSDPGKSVTMKITVKNTGNSPNTIYLDDPVLPEDWTSSWSGGSSASIPADSTRDFTLNIQIPVDYTKALARLYQFQITGEYETDSGNEPIPGFAQLNLTVNPVYGVEVTSDDISDSKKPGESITFHAEVKNTGNTNETFKLSLLKAEGLGDAKDWAVIQGAETGDILNIEAGETKFVDVVVNIPQFTPDSDDAKMGDFGVVLKAKSSTESSKESEVTFTVTVEEIYNVRVWSDTPGKEETLKENDDTVMTYTISVRNLGNTQDTITISVPTDEFSGDKKDWSAAFDGDTSTSAALDSLQQTTVTLTLTIDKGTDAGNYTLRVKAESSGDTAVYMYATLYVNLSKARYGVELEKVTQGIPKVNPADKSEIEFKFTLTNTGNQDDTYTLEVETSVTSGTYKDWKIEFEDKNFERVDTLKVPTDLPGQTDTVVGKGKRIDITLYVTVAIDEDEGNYPDIQISATSDNDHAQVAYLSFNLTVIKPNIRVDNDPQYFYIDPKSGIEEGDSVDITVRVYNDGTAETGKFYVWFYNGRSSSPAEQAGNPIGGNPEKVDNIPAGSYFDVTTTWDNIPAGENDIYVYADKPVKTPTSSIGKTYIDGEYSSDGLVLESRENDNYASIDDTFQHAIDLRPDLTVTSVTYDSRTAGDSTTVTVTVSNIGSAKAVAGTAIVKVKIKGEYLKDKKTSSTAPVITEEIDVNDDVEIDFKWDVPKDTGNYIVKATVDHPDDSDSSNDRYETNVTVESKATQIAGIEASSTTILLGFGIFILLFIVVVGLLMIKLKKAHAAHGHPPAPPKEKKKEAKPPKGKKTPPAKPGAKPPAPGAKPPKPGEKPLTPPPAAKGKVMPPKPGAKPPAPGAKPPKPGEKPPVLKVIKCPKCGSPIEITTTKRPLKVTCPKCGATGTITK